MFQAPLPGFTHYKKVVHLHLHSQKLHILIFVFSSSVPLELEQEHSGSFVLELASSSDLHLEWLVSMFN